MDNDDPLTIIEKVNKIIGSYVEDEILEFKRLSKYSRTAYNFLTVATVVTTSSIPFITHLDNKLVTVGVLLVISKSRTCRFYKNLRVIHFIRGFSASREILK